VDRPQRCGRRLALHQGRQRPSGQTQRPAHNISLHRLRRGESIHTHTHTHTSIQTSTMCTRLAAQSLNKSANSTCPTPKHLPSRTPLLRQWSSRICASCVAGHVFSFGRNDRAHLCHGPWSMVGLYALGTPLLTLTHASHCPIPPVL
jgi:hypothetical protein